MNKGSNQNVINITAAAECRRRRRLRLAPGRGPRQGAESRGNGSTGDSLPVRGLEKYPYHPGDVLVTSRAMSLLFGTTTIPVFGARWDPRCSGGGDSGGAAGGRDGWGWK